MTLPTLPSFSTIISEPDFGVVDLAAMQADAAREVLASGAGGAA
jgi:hypothetical protein